MGIAMQTLERFVAMGVLKPGASVLDIGSSNLYSAHPETLRLFMSHFGCDVAQDGLDQFIDRMAKGSAYGPAGGTNESFVGELIERVGMKYLALDIADGYRTKIFDLNRRPLEPALHGTFDAVINCGTTEHLLNQINAFSVIHDATKVGGHMVHDLPSLGFVDHGYVRYTPQFFFDLAQYNDYDVVYFDFQGPMQGKNIYAAIADYARQFPNLAKTINSPPEALASAAPSDIGIMVVLQKKANTRFRVPVEMRTSVGDVDINEAGFAPSNSDVMSTRQLYKIGASALSAAVRRTPLAIARAVARLVR